MNFRLVLFAIACSLPICASFAVGGSSQLARTDSVLALTLTGWGQMPDVLDSIVPAGCRINHFPYYTAPDRDTALNNLDKLPEQPQVVVCWSLGGRIAVHAIAKKRLNPKLLVLIGSSFRFVPGRGLDRLAGGEPFAFADLYRNSPKTARERLEAAIADGDTCAKVVRAALKQDSDHDKEWLHWLHELRFGCDELDLTRMPRTLVIHGHKDAVVNVEQAGLFMARIPNVRVEIMPEAGHAPHLHCPAKIREIIRDELVRLSN